MFDLSNLNSEFKNRRFRRFRRLDEKRRRSLPSTFLFRMHSGGGERQTPRFQSSAESAGSGSLRWRKRRPIEDDDEHEDENPNFDFLKLFEVGFNLGPPPFQERRQRKVFAKIRNIFVDCESRAIGRKFKENVIWFAEVQA